MKMKSDKLKGYLVIAGFLLLLSICFYRNLESRIKGLYESNQYPGDIRITGFSFTSQDTLGIDVNYNYSEKVDGKDISIPLKKKLKFDQLIIPYYPHLDKYGQSKFFSKVSNMFNEEYNPYVPILKKALELNPESKKIEQDIQRKMNENSKLQGSTIKLEFSIWNLLKTHRSMSWLTDYEQESLEKGRTVLGGWYDFPVKDALNYDVIYVQITLPSGVDKDSFRLKEELESLLQKTSLPNAVYVIETEDEFNIRSASIKDGKVKERG